MMTWMNLMCLDPASYVCEQIIFFHDLLLMILILVVVFLINLMILMVKNFYMNRFMIHGHTIEIIWTLIPMILLMILAFPSLSNLYYSDELIRNPLISIKAIGHQWYWSYEYMDIKELDFDSYMLIEGGADKFRLLDVDNRMVIPYKVDVRLLISSDDVIHSWAVPSLGLKVDGVPGRINQLNLMLDYVGLFFGQCSEICGVNHSFMPIVVEGAPWSKFVNWLKFN